MPHTQHLLPQQLPKLPAGSRQEYGCAYGCGGALFIVELQARTKRPVVVISATVAAAESLEGELRFFANKQQRIDLYADPESLPYDSFSPHPDLVSRRLALLGRLLNDDVDIVVLAAPTLSYRLPPETYVRQRSLEIHKGQRLDLADLSSQLTVGGYARVAQVGEPGEMAVRGSLIDLFPMGHNSPIRVDFFDNEIDSIREFDPDTQRSGAELDALHMLPARDFPTDNEAIKSFRGRYRERFEGNPADSLIYSEVSEGRFPGGIENYFPLFFDVTWSLWDYLSDATLIVSMGHTESLLEATWNEIGDRFEQYRHDAERPALAPDELFIESSVHIKEIDLRAHIQLSRHELPEATQLNLAANKAPAVMINVQTAEPLDAIANFLSAYSGRVLFAAESPGRREMLLELFRNRKISLQTVADWAAFQQSDVALGILVAPLAEGTELAASGMCLIAEHELFGARPARRRKRKTRDPETILNDLSDLREGSPVVHEHYGVGRYQGLSNLVIDAVANDFLTLEYAGGDRLHVPVASLHLVSRYTGATPEHAPLHRLGTDQWERAKHKAAKQIRDVAAELLDLYATRAARSGRSMRVNLSDYERFCSAFPFELTDDQATAVAATLVDLEASQSMDRLVCGDVGFGKTEVALRAAFVAAMNGSQVAILAPTTLLVQQHFQTFSDRFADWPVNVEALSRFSSAKEAREVMASMATGHVDIVIGTHKLLQESVEFKNLGLVIVDEEHRFGVRHKERLKSLRAEVDLLTLTATPIPRTLNMALGELRELSVITTPPETRLSIKTFVTEWRAALVREACQRELKRGGQVYFVHNRVKDIEQQAARLQEIMPEATIQVAHGQMRERELEQIMLDFSHRRFHILVCTAIIESGLDIPSANTIIINRADHFGLAQLHQLRGRVGRSHHQAFAYLIAPPEHLITADAAKRLDAIEAMEDLGAGFVLATHDLEIRGAGELLGEQQTGQMQQIGFNLYTELLGRAVTAIRRGETPDLEASNAAGCEVNLRWPAVLPEEYLPDVQMRLMHYKRIASAVDLPTLRELQVELIDRFGLLPVATSNLFRQAALRLAASKLGIEKLEATASGATIRFGKDSRIDTTQLVRLIGDAPDRYGFDRSQRFILKQNLADEDERFAVMEQLISDWAEGANNADAITVSV